MIGLYRRELSGIELGADEEAHATGLSPRFRIAR
jgi:hypothetical protein